MHPGIHALVTLDLDSNLFTSLQMPAVRGLEAVSIRPQYISFSACRNQLLELTKVIGMDLPSRFFVLGAANFHRDAINWAVIWSPHRAENHCEVIGRGPLPGVGARSNYYENCQAGEKTQDERGVSR